MEKFKYSLLVLFGACSYGILSTIFKLGFINGFSAHQLLGGQYVFGWIGLFLLVLFFSRHKVTKKQFFSLLTVGTTMSMTGIFYAISVEELPASIAVVLLFQFTWIGVIIEAIANRTFPNRDKIISILILFAGTLFAGGVFEGARTKFFYERDYLWTISCSLFFILCFCKRARRYGCSALYEKLPYDNKRYSYRMPILSANLFNRRCFASRSMEICFLPRIIRRCCTCHLFFNRCTKGWNRA